MAVPVYASPAVFNVSGIENIEWLELTVTAGKSRLEVESMLTTGGVLDGWRYASRSEVETLYDSLWGGTTDGYSSDNFAGAAFLTRLEIIPFTDPRDTMKTGRPAGIHCSEMTMNVVAIPSIHVWVWLLYMIWILAHR